MQSAVADRGALSWPQRGSIAAALFCVTSGKPDAAARIELPRTGGAAPQLARKAGNLSPGGQAALKELQEELHAAVCEEPRCLSPAVQQLLEVAPTLPVTQALLRRRVATLQAVEKPQKCYTLETAGGCYPEDVAAFMRSPQTQFRTKNGQFSTIYAARAAARTWEAAAGGKLSASPRGVGRNAYVALEKNDNEYNAKNKVFKEAQKELAVLLPHMPASAAARSGNGKLYGDQRKGGVQAPAAVGAAASAGKRARGAAAAAAAAAAAGASGGSTIGRVIHLLARLALLRRVQPRGGRECF